MYHVCFDCKTHLPLAKAFMLITYLVFVQANEAGVTERRAKSDVLLTDSESVDEETNVYTLNNL